MRGWVPRRAGAPAGSLAGPGPRKHRGRVGLKSVFLARLPMLTPVLFTDWECRQEALTVMTQAPAARSRRRSPVPCPCVLIELPSMASRATSCWLLSHPLPTWKRHVSPELSTGSPRARHSTASRRVYTRCCCGGVSGIRMSKQRAAPSCATVTGHARPMSRLPTGARPHLAGVWDPLHHFIQGL